MLPDKAFNTMPLVPVTDIEGAPDDHTHHRSTIYVPAGRNTDRVVVETVVLVTTWGPDKVVVSTPVPSAVPATKLVLVLVND